jgi:hypothetical protein
MDRFDDASTYLSVAAILSPVPNVMLDECRNDEPSAVSVENADNEIAAGIVTTA